MIDRSKLRPKYWSELRDEEIRKETDAFIVVIGIILAFAVSVEAVIRCLL